MKTFALLVAGALGILSVVGCSGSESAPDAESETTEGALSHSARLLSKAVAVEMDVTPLPRGAGETITVTVGLSATVRSIVDLKKTRESATSEAACSGHKANLRFLDESGKQVGKSQLVCGVGVLDIPGMATIGVKTDVDLLEIAKAPRVAADALWGITSVAVKDVRSNIERNVTDADAVKKLVSAIKPAAQIDRNRPLPRCLPSYAATFKRGQRDVASTNFACGGGTDALPESVTASFYVLAENEDEGFGGGLDLDPRPFVAAVTAD